MLHALLRSCRSTAAAMQQLGGSWKLVYTNHTATLMVLNAIRGIPLVDLGEVYQVIQPETMQAYNKVGVFYMLMVQQRKKVCACCHQPDCTHHIPLAGAWCDKSEPFICCCSVHGGLTH